MEPGSRKRAWDNFAGVSNPTDQTKKMGNWEKHTKGIGAKLLLKMGYQPGKGLGKAEQGITVPIIAQKREAAVGIGYNGAEYKQKAIFAGDVEKANEAKKQQQHQVVDSEGRKQVRDSKGKVMKTYVYKSVDEVLTENLSGVPSLSSRDIIGTTKVIDMRGPEQKVLGGYHDIGSRHLRIQRGNLTPAQKELHEIEVNLQLLVDIVEQDVIRKNRAIRSEKERLRYLDDEHQYIREKIDQEKRNVLVIEKALASIGQVKQQFDNGSLTSFKLQDFCCSFIEQFPNEHGIINLSELIEGMAFPIVTREISNWNTLSNPTFCLETFKSWEKLMNKVDTKLYQLFIWEVWMPRVRREIMQMPSMKQSDELIHFLDIWKPLIPAWIINNIISQIIVPRLENQVDEWNPLTDPIPIHSWIHPWLPIVDDSSALENVYAPIRQKLGIALTNWHPSDMSAKVILLPWKAVFSAATWDAFMGVNIVPKLETVMQSLVVNPQNQEGIEAWSWILAWEDLLSLTVISSIFEKNFFPKWLHALHQWLLHSPNFEEVGNWYSGWKGMLTPALAGQPVIKDFLRRALEMMDHAVSAPGGMATYRPSPAITPRMVEQMKLRQEILNTATTPSNSNLNFKQLVTRKADEHGILFMPIQNKTFEGKQVYQFGKLRIYMDRSVIFVHNASTNKWDPTSLQALIGMAG